MTSEKNHIRQIKVVSNTHWDREFRLSFERTRRRLVSMFDTTLKVLSEDPDFHSVTMDGHSVLLEDYLEIRPENREVVQQHIENGKLIFGPYYTLAEEFSITHEALVRNLMFGRKVVDKYRGKQTSVAYTPSSWGQTGQLPQILRDFGCTRMMFYRGISHHESDAEFVWSAPDGTKVIGSRFALYARYNWYYQVFRPATRRRDFQKDYQWGEFDETPFRLADPSLPAGGSYELLSPSRNYEPQYLADAIEKMVQVEGPHFTTEVFLGMQGHDISVPHPLEGKMVRDAAEVLKGMYTIEHTNLDQYWDELEKHLDFNKLPVLVGERRSYLKKGMWTYLFPSTISVRTYLKQQDFEVSNRLLYSAEPLTSLAALLGSDVPQQYLTRAWRYLLSNHTHDANGGCAPDSVCRDMEYRYRKVRDIADVLAFDSMAYIAENLSGKDVGSDELQLIVFNALPFERDAVVRLEVDIPASAKAKSFTLTSKDQEKVELQPVSASKSSVFIDSGWDVPTILDSSNVQAFAKFEKLPGLGYRTYKIKPSKSDFRVLGSIIKGNRSLENEHLRVDVNQDGTIDLYCKATSQRFESINYLSDQGEVGNAWRHKAPTHDKIFTSNGVSARVFVSQSGPLSGAITAQYEFEVPVDYGDGTTRSEQLVALPVEVEYRLEASTPYVQVTLSVDNRAKDHWLRANFPTSIKATHSHADSHFDVVSREIAIPDSTDWVEAAGGTHPLRTFVDINNKSTGFGLLSKGLFEYEVHEDENTTLSLTLIRACRIKLAVSEEKQTELPDEGVQCPGRNRFEYALCPHKGDWNSSQLLNLSASYVNPVRAAVSGRGKGNLPQAVSALTLDNMSLHVTTIKPAESGKGIIVRLFNPLEESQNFSMAVPSSITSASNCLMDESVVGDLAVRGGSVSAKIPAKKIMTLLLT
jgi:mannosylglycerate hydrolase